MGTVFLKLIAEAVAAAVARFAPVNERSETLGGAIALGAVAGRGGMRMRGISPQTRWVTVSRSARRASLFAEHDRSLRPRARYAGRAMPNRASSRAGAICKPGSGPGAHRRRASPRTRAGDAARACVGVAQFLPLPRARGRSHDQSGDRRALAARQAQAARSARRRRNDRTGRSARRRSRSGSRPRAVRASVFERPSRFRAVRRALARSRRRPKDCCASPARVRKTRIVPVGAKALAALRGAARRRTSRTQAIRSFAHAAASR